MDLVIEENVDELLKAQTHMWNHTPQFIKSMSLKCAVELGIPDIINNHGQPMPLSDLVSALEGMTLGLIMVNEVTASDSIFLGQVAALKCKEAFKGLNSLVDVAGGTGNMSKGIANAFPSIKCTALDLPHVVAVADSQGAKNLNFVVGDMFRVAHPADAALIKWVLHDWADEYCVKILKNCKEAITRNGKQENNHKDIIIDMVMANKNSDDDLAETEFCLI
ncbi:hypothetical protein JCGZ_10379 [Jatropha curcas]|uniref:O-methyltransferase C-terminal domain-containing protein n=1 Tax=Jatropha curcas TaxID=180498 RepID=A0A067KSY8_JATCU|nr:hypothetical protein JCGZ_10379 [Jatropha curcas]